MASSTVRLCSVPAYVYNVNSGDEIAVIRSAEGALVATGITGSSGQWTFRVWLPDGDDRAWLAVAESYAEAGCLVDVLTPRLLAFSCAADAAGAIADRLKADQDAGRFIYETGRLT